MTEIEKTVIVVNTLAELGAEATAENVRTLMGFQKRYDGMSVSNSVEFLNYKAREFTDKILATEVVDEIIEAVKEGQILLAVKRFKELTNSGLKDAKDTIDEMRDRFILK